MKHYKIVLLPFFYLVAITLLYAQAAGDWKTYSSREGKFTILLPGEPTVGYRPINMDSPSSVTHVINLQTPTAAYIIAYFDLPALPSGATNVKKIIDDTRDRIVKMSSLKLESQSEAKLMEYSGLTLRMRTPDGKSFLSQIFVVKQRVYHLSLVPLSKQTEAGEIAKFFDSFKPTPLTDEEIKNLPPPQAENEKATPRIIRVSEGVLQNRATKRVEPTYPKEAKKAGVSGVVNVRVLVSEQGQVVEAEALSGPEQLREAAVKAAQQWAFKPMAVGKYPVKIIGVLIFNFRHK